MATVGDEKRETESLLLSRLLRRRRRRRLEAELDGVAGVQLRLREALYRSRRLIHRRRCVVPSKFGKYMGKI